MKPGTEVVFKTASGSTYQLTLERKRRLWSYGTLTRKGKGRQLKASPVRMFRSWAIRIGESPRFLLEDCGEGAELLQPSPVVRLQVR